MAGGIAVLATSAMKVEADANRMQPFDPDMTALPFANPAPILPFQGKLSPEEAKARYQAPVTPRPPRGGLQAEVGDPDETLAMPVPGSVLASVAASGPRPAELTLERYAALRAMLAVHGEGNDAVLREFGLSHAEKDALQRQWFERFQSNPELSAEFQRLVSIAMARIREGAPP